MSPLQITLHLPNPHLADLLAGEMGRRFDGTFPVVRTPHGHAVSAAIAPGVGFAFTVPLLGAIDFAHELDASLVVKAKPSVAALIRAALPVSVERLEEGRVCLGVKPEAGRAYPIAVPLVGVIFVQVEST